MKRIIIYLIFTLSLLIVACTITNTQTTKSNPKNKPAKQESSKGKKIVDAKKQPAKPKARFNDTTTVVVKDSGINQKPEIVKQFEESVEYFEKGNYDKGCEKIDMFTETFAKGDSLQYEALFQKSECLIVKDEIESAENILTSLYKTKNLPPSIMEKVLVRLGQVFCAQNRKIEAEKLFYKLKKSFPSSIYIPLANCDAVK